MTDYEGYPAQILAVIAKNCRPNSPIQDRAYMNLRPRGGKIRGLGAALDALVRANLVERMPGRAWQIKPTPLGYAAVAQMKARRAAARMRPPLYDRVIPQPIEVGESAPR